jgi:F-type H+-transporting ATPase subunit alpha
MKKVAGQLKLSLSQFRDLEAFAAFASDLDAASRAQLDRGARLVELLKQPQYSPFPVEEQVVSIWAGTTGQLDDVPVEDIRRFESEFLDYLRRSYSGLLTSIRETKDLTDDNISTLKEAIDKFRRTFEVTGGNLLVADDEPAQPLGEGEHSQESVAKYRDSDAGDSEAGDTVESSIESGSDVSANPRAASDGE